MRLAAKGQKLRWCIVLLFCMELLATGCRKNKDEPEIIPEASSSRITFGNAQGLSVSSISGLVVDVNDDGTQDLELSSESVKSGPGPLYATVVTLKCLHSDIGIRSEQRRDTSFANTTVSVASGSFQVPGNLKIFKTTLYSESCSRSPGAIVKSAEQSLHFKGYQAGEWAEPNESFTSAALLIQGYRSSFSELTGPVGDTVYVQKTSLYMDCRQDLSAPETYFCFKLIENSKAQLGWVKVSAKTTGFSEIAIRN